MLGHFGAILPRWGCNLFGDFHLAIYAPLKLLLLLLFQRFSCKSYRIEQITLLSYRMLRIVLNEVAHLVIGYCLMCVITKEVYLVLAFSRRPASNDFANFRGPPRVAAHLRPVCVTPFKVELASACPARSSCLAMWVLTNQLFN